MKLAISIDGTDRSVILETVQITQNMNGVLPQAQFNMYIPGPTIANYPVQFSEVIITNVATGVAFFHGFVTNILITLDSRKVEIWQVQCSGLEYLLQNVTVNNSWTATTDLAIIQDAFGSALPEIATTSATVSTLLTDLDFTAKDLTLIHILPVGKHLSSIWILGCPEHHRYFNVQLLTSCLHTLH
jgi:hypothetical protein